MFVQALRVTEMKFYYHSLLQFHKSAFQDLESFDLQCKD